MHTDVGGIYIFQELLTAAHYLHQAQSATKGSTDLWQVLHTLYLLPPMTGPDHPRNVFLISDGHVTEEAATLDLIHKNARNNRIFTFGVR